MARLEVTTQITKGARVLAQHGTVVIDAGQLALYDSRNNLITHAPLRDVHEESPWWLMGGGVRLRIGAARYHLSLRGLGAALSSGITSSAGFVLSGRSITKRFRAAMDQARLEADTNHAAVPDEER